MSELREASLYGFSREDLDAIASGLESEPATINVGNTTGEGDELLQSTTAAAAKFIRAALSAEPAQEMTDDPGPLLDDEGRAMVGASHHYTAENIRALIAELKRLEDPQQCYSPYRALEQKDIRAWCGVLWRVMSGLACDVPLAADRASRLPEMPPALESLFDIANELHGEFDKQTYDEHRRAGWDTPDDAELCVSITAKQERALSRAIVAVEAYKALVRGKT